MQGLHHQQQQLAALLSVALPKDESSSSDSDEVDSARLAALHSLHRAILYPANSLLVVHTASFLSQGFSQLLSDKSNSVRRSAAVAYGALCSVVCSSHVVANGRQSHVLTASLVDRFIAWALPLLRNVGVGDGTVELGLEGLREFLSVGDVVAIERYALPILKACQELLEDERTSLGLLHQLLGLLTLISSKFGRCFQPHFVDIIDLLLGWALVPDLLEPDRGVIMNSFLQFQKHWFSNLHFSLGLLSKFLGDMDVLLQDGTPGTEQHFRRLLALLSCFSTVLQATASGMLEMNLLEQISEPLCRIIPKLLTSLSMVGKKFGWSRWIGEFSRCLTLLAEILCEKFSSFYPVAVDVLFQSLSKDDAVQPSGYDKVPSLQIHGVLKTNLQLLSLQKLGLLPSSVQKLLQFDAPISQLRLHVNHLVTGSSAATYLYLLRHGSDEIVEQAMNSLIKELEFLKGLLGKFQCHGNGIRGRTDSKQYSKLELFALVKFNLTVLLSSVSSGDGRSSLAQSDIVGSYNERSLKLASFVLEELNPFDNPFHDCVSLQVSIVKTLKMLSKVEFSSKYASSKNSGMGSSVDIAMEEVMGLNNCMCGHSVMSIGCLSKYTLLLIRALHISSPVAVKLEALDWISCFCEHIITVNEYSNAVSYLGKSSQCVGDVRDLVFSILDASSDREMKVRSQVASSLELLLQARLIYPENFSSIAEVILEKLGDPEISIKNAYVRVLSLVLPVTIYASGLSICEIVSKYRPGVIRLSNGSYLHWKQVFALKQLPRQFHSQQLTSVLSYISQRWKVPFSSWVQRLVYGCRTLKEFPSGQLVEMGNLGANCLWMDVEVEGDILEKICSVNNLAGAWWSIHEASRYCVAARLRTNLGGPTQTFAALERMLLDIAHVLQLNTEQNDGTLNIGTSTAHLLPMRLLLDFVEALKKNVYNAYDGSAVLPCANHQSSLFFRANKKVCEEWFSRICEPMMNAGLALNCHDATIHYCMLRLQDLRNLVASTLKDKSRTQSTESLYNLRGGFAGDILRVLRHVALALCRSHEPEALIGLQKWATITFSSLFVDDSQNLSHSVTLGHFSWMAGLVYQAKGQYERAAAHFSHLLQSEEALSFMGSDGVQFAIARAIESFTALSDWRSLESWLLELQALRAKHAGKSYSGALTTAGNEMNAVHALARFDEGDVQAAWAYLDLTPKSSNELTLDPKLALQRSEQILLQAMLFHIDEKEDKVLSETEKARLLLDEAVSILPLDGLNEAGAYATQLHCIFALEEGHKLKQSQVEEKQFHSLLNSCKQFVLSPINRVNQDCNLWLKVFRVYCTVLPTSLLTLKLCQNLMSLARKQRNLMLARRLSHYLKDNVFRCCEKRYCDLLNTSLQYEDILLMHAENNIEDALTNLWYFVRPHILSPTAMVSDADDRTLKAKACLKLSGWLGRDYTDAVIENVVLKIQMDFCTSDASSLCRDGPPVSSGNLDSKQRISVILDEIVGTTTKMSTIICPTMGKSWLSYASWCYSHASDSLSGQHDTVLWSCSFSPVLIPEVQSDRFKLNEEEISKVESIIAQIFHKKKDLNDTGGESLFGLKPGEHLSMGSSMKSLVQQAINVIETAAGTPGIENFDAESPSAMLSSQLQMLFRCADAELGGGNILSSINDLVDVWLSLRRRRVLLFGHAAHGFMKYLLFSSSKVCEGHLADSYCDSSKQQSGSYTLRATLYVLHILLNYGVELRDILEPGLATVPLFPWQEITPQLFARLSSHPEQVVRNQLEGLLMLLAKQSPWSIVYPTLVDVNAYEGEPSEELQHLLGCLGKLYPRLVQDVQLVICELGNVTVLWEELWLSTLQDLRTDVMRRINMLKEEAARLAENVTLSLGEKNKINAAKYSAMMAPVVVALERRLASTSREPKTPHEIWFHEEYGEQLKSAILKFKTPPVSAAAIGDVWHQFDDISASLATYQRKPSISLGDVAPQLALLASSDVPMPGLEKQTKIAESAGGHVADIGRIVTIASFSEEVTILSTKTKPKKLVIVGSDGQKYTYLLKGREDLRLDARIMQLLQAINNFLHSSPETRGHSLGIRYYSVTPISGRAGLIQWVDNVVSIYSIFKSWQNRVQHAQLSSAGASNTSKTAFQTVPRPSDMFYGKIIPALKEKGIRRVISRRDWPHEVKRKVLVDLMKETPRQLLHQELWCASEGFKAFSSKVKRYSGSLAAMSMVGHILGLGDRHLDNILMDFCSGDIVHIDYNVCFDKGKRLKIPEIVPFRLTQTIEAALGLTGIEGTFRANCEAVVGVLKRNKDILLMLLEVFVWDPLVEWARGDHHDEAAIGGEERKGMELAVSLSLFASRVQEIRVPLQEHHDLLLATLPAVESALERFLNVLNQYETVSALFYRADQERSNLILHETSAKSLVAEATSNSEKTHASFEIQAREFAQAKAATIEKAREVTAWMEQHGRILDALRSGSIPDFNACIKISGMQESLSLTSAVLVAGVPLTIVPEPTQAQCHDLDKDVYQLIVELDDGTSCLVKALQSYSLALQRILPLNYITTSPMYGWEQLLQLWVKNLSSDVLSLVRRQATDLMSKTKGDNVDSLKRRHEALCLKVENYAKEIEEVGVECAELVNSIGSETESKAKDRLLSAFTNYMQLAGIPKKEDGVSFMQLGLTKLDRMKCDRPNEELEEKRDKVLSVLHMAASALYNDVKGKVLGIVSKPTGEMDHRHAGDSLQSHSGTTFCELEEQIERCMLVSGFVNELQQHIAGDLPSIGSDMYQLRYSSDGNWASIFQACLLSCKILVGQMTEVVLPEIVKLVVSYNSEVMDAFGSLSQIRGSIETSLEQLIEVELEKASLVELEQNYFVKVGLITEQQLALEEATVKGRDNLSWEEAEELASQEEACRAQLNQLHQSWNQKDMRTSSLIKREAGIRSALVSAERHFLSFIRAEQERDPHILRSKLFLATLAKPFSELESLDQILSSFCGSGAFYSNEIPSPQDLMNSGYSMSESVWKFSGLLNHWSFFIWKIGIMDSFLDACIHDVSSSVDQNLGFDQLNNVLKKKLEIHLQEHIGHYLKERVAPALITCIEKENEHLKNLMDATKEHGFDQVRKDFGAVTRVQLMLEEYCNAHETARAARSAVSVMEKQVNELKEALWKTSLEIVQMEWLHDVSLPAALKNRIICQNFLENDDKFYPIILKLNRSNLMETMQSTVSSLTRSLECLQACERTSVSVEGQLERAMGWACGGPTTGGIRNISAKSSGIPPEFHDHLIRRQQLLWKAREQASDIIKVSTSILEFEASRDGIFWTQGEISGDGTGGDGRTWQQSYMNALTKLDVSYHSFTRSEKEWKMAQSNMEAAANGLFSAINELSLASVKAKSASGDLQGTLVAMRDCACEASVALSAFGRVTRGHTALTSECGSMLDEFLAITEGLHDVHSLGKEAAAVHGALMADLSKANKTLLPLESVLSTDVAAMTDAISWEGESKAEIPPIHGQAIYQSYSLRIREACQSFNPLVPSLTLSVKELYSTLTRLARTASLHAGNLHKALEGLGESQGVRSQEINLSRSDLADNVTAFDNKDIDTFSRSSGGNTEKLPDIGYPLHHGGWISPPDSIPSSGSESGISSAETSLLDSFDGQENTMEQFSQGFGSRETRDYLDSLPFSVIDNGEDSSCGQSESLHIEGRSGGTECSLALEELTEHLQVSASPKSIVATEHTDTLHPPSRDSEIVKSGHIDEVSALNPVKGQDGYHEASLPHAASVSRINKGKNAYAISVLRRVEMKIDGQDIDNNREIDIVEQVDYLLKQAMSVDNLCNMYEGWTPWI